MSRHRSYYPPTNPATTEGWERVKTALAALRKQGYGAGLTAASAKGRKGSKGCVYCRGTDARDADERGVLLLSFGVPEGTPDEGWKATAAVGRVACEALTAAGALWWWDGNGAYSILVNVAKSPEDFKRDEAIKAAKARCSEAQKVAHAAHDKLAKLTGNNCGYGPAHTDWTYGGEEKHDAAYYDGEAARYARETRAAEAASAAYEAVMNPALPPAPALEWLGTCCACGKVIAEDHCEKTVCGECQARIDGRSAVGTAEVL